jgi:hypothetical protein
MRHPRSPAVQLEPPKAELEGRREGGEKIYLVTGTPGFANNRRSTLHGLVFHERMPL